MTDHNKGHAVQLCGCGGEAIVYETCRVCGKPICKTCAQYNMTLWNKNSVLTDTMSLEAIRGGSKDELICLECAKVKEAEYIENMPVHDLPLHLSNGWHFTKSEALLRERIANAKVHKGRVRKTGRNARRSQK